MAKTFLISTIFLDTKVLCWCVFNYVGTRNLICKTLVDNLLWSKGQIFAARSCRVMQPYLFYIIILLQELTTSITGWNSVIFFYSWATLTSSGIVFWGLTFFVTKGMGESKRYYVISGSKWNTKALLKWNKNLECTHNSPGASGTENFPSFHILFLKIAFSPRPTFFHLKNRCTVLWQKQNPIHFKSGTKSLSLDHYFSIWSPAAAYTTTILL